MTKTRIAILTVMLLISSALSLAPARAETPQDPVSDLVDAILNCTLSPNVPYVTPMAGAPVRLMAVEGSGSVNGCHPDGVVVVCLDYFAVTWPNSCRWHGVGADGSGGGASGQAPCLPGIWQTSIKVLVPGPDPQGLHSDPLIVGTGCLERS